MALYPKRVAAADVTTPPTDHDAWFVDDGVLVIKDDSGAVIPIGGPPAITTLTDGATVPWDVTNLREDVATLTIGGNRTLDIVGAAAGFRGTILVTQDGTGSRTLTLPANSIVRDAGAGAITLSTAAGSKDMLVVMYDGTNYWWSYGVDFT